MLQKPPDKFLVGQAHHLLPVAVGVIAPAKANRILVKGRNTVVAYSHPVGITPQIAQQLLRPSKRRLGIYYPILNHQPVQQAVEGLLAAKTAAQTIQAQAPSLVMPAQSADKLALEHGRQGLYWYEELLTG